jgi:hypothetical protein
MLSIIEKLEDKELAYQGEDGDVNYAVRNFPGYGKLSGKSLDDLRAGERVDVNTGKRDPLDFVLWKAGKENEPAEARWESKWGVGRPGWHIECSAMSCAMLGEHFDIHGGGADLQFPHHENEIAQSEGAFGAPMANYWIHNGFVRVDNEKMSKSLGNFFTIRDVLEIRCRSAALLHPARPLPQPAELFGRPHRRRQGRADAPVHGPGRVDLGSDRWSSTGTKPTPSASAKRWTTISIRRWPWPSCSTWRRKSTAANRWRTRAS